MPPAESRPLDVLVVEDNPVNRKFVVALLSKWGHHVVAADDGVRCLEEIERRAFDLVLMDIQMPAMDGIEATCAIRKRELQSGGHVPIIALTAHARAQDESRCLDAGMDGYLTKPIDSDLLRDAIAGLVLGNDAAPAVAIAPAVASAVDFARLEEFVGDDPELLAEVIQIFLDDAPVALAKVDAAILGADAAALEHAAHRLKGSLLAMGAEAASAAAWRLEALAQEGGLGGASQVREELHREVAATCDGLRLWQAKRAA